MSITIIPLTRDYCVTLVYKTDNFYLRDLLVKEIHFKSEFTLT